MMNNTIQHLEEVKSELLKRAAVLQKELESWETSEQRITKVLIPLDEDVGDVFKRIQCNNRTLQVSEHVSGMNWQNGTKTWLNDNIYLYKTSLVSALLDFQVEVKIDLQDETDESDCEILDIVCKTSHFQPSYKNEIIPWIKKFTKTKNFAYLMHSVSAYNAQALIRVKLLSILRKEKYATLEPFEIENGGVLAFVHSPTNTSKIYLKIHWTIQLVESPLGMDHRFNITPTEIGEIFLEQNPNMIGSFNRINFTKNEISEIWTDLCTAIDIYENGVDDETGTAQ